MLHHVAALCGGSQNTKVAPTILPAAQLASDTAAAAATSCHPITAKLASANATESSTSASMCSVLLLPSLQIQDMKYIKIPSKTEL